MRPRTLWRRRSRSACVLLSLLVMAPAVLALGQDDAKETAALRRVYVPADRTAQWPKDPGVEYVPVEPAEFERLLEVIRKSPLENGVSATSRVARSTYRCRLDGDGVLAGEAALEVVVPGGSAVLLPLDPCNLAIRDPKWQSAGPAGTGAAQSPLVLGQGADGKLAAAVGGSGELHFGWSLRGTLRRDGSRDFTLALPDSPVKTLVLELPARWQLTASHGAIQVESGPAEPATAEKTAVGAALRTWRLTLGGQRQVTLTLQDEKTAQQPPRVIARQQSNYELSHRGLEMTAEFTLDIQERALADWTVELDEGLQLVEARVGESSLAWSELGSPAGGAAGGPAQVRLNFPWPMSGVGRVVRLSAIAPLEAGKRWRLPGIRPADGSWQEGRARVRIKPPLSLDHLFTQDCRQSLPLADGELELQYFTPAAAAEVVVGRRESFVQISAGSAIELAPGEAAGELIAQIAPTEGLPLELSADIGPRWTIDEVAVVNGEKEAAESPIDWQVEGQVLRLRLPRTPLARGALRLAIRGRRLEAATGRTMPIGGLEIVRFHQAVVTRHVMAVSSRPPLRVDLVGNGDVTRLDPRKLAAEDASCFRRTPAGLVFVFNARAARGRLEVSRLEPRFSAAVRTGLVVTAGPIWETYTVRCDPQGSKIAQVRIQFSEPLEGPLTWAVVGSEEAPAARRLSAAEKTEAGLPSEGETWQVTLPAPRETPLVLRATRARQAGPRQAVTLASVPEAEDQSGVLAVRAPREVGLAVETGRLHPIALDPDAADDATDAQDQFLAYRYDPARDASPVSGLPPAIVLTRSEGGGPAREGVVWQASLRSKYEAKGAGHHELTLWLDRGGRDALTFTTPGPVEDLDVRVDGQRAGVEAPSQKVVVRLSGERRLCVVTAAYRTREQPLGLATPASAPLPRFDFAVVRQQWLVGLPSGYAVQEEGASWDSTSAVSWRRRLFGPLARGEGQRRFDPLAADDWRGLSRPQLPRVSDGARDERALARIRGEGENVWGTWGAVAGTSEPAGWQVWRFDAPTGAAPRVRIVHTLSYEMCLWAATLVVAAAVWIAGRARARAAVLVAIAAAAVALAVPEAWVPWSSRASLGVLAGTALVWLVPRRRTSAVGGNSMRRAAAPVSAALLVGGLWIGDDAGRAADAPDKGTVHKVLIPVDDDGKPAKDAYDWVPRKLMETLEQSAARIERRPRGWLIERATYRGTLGRGEVDVVVTLDLRVFGPERRVSIDFGADGANRRGNEAVLDGEPIDVHWEDGGRRLSFDVPGPGAYRLELPLRPRVRRADSYTFELDAAIPAVARAQLELSVADNLESVAAPSALGAVRREVALRTVSAELGPAGRLIVRWPDAASAAPAVDVEELLWLHVKPGSVVLHAKFLCQVKRGALRELHLSGDPRWQLLPSPQGEAASIRPETPADAPAGPAENAAWRVEFSRPQSGQVEVEARMLLSEASGIGRLHVPRLSVDSPGARSTRRWAAASIDPLLVYEAVPEAGMESLAPAAFVSAWGAAPAPPQIAFRSPGPETRWSLLARPRTPARAAQQTLAASFSRGRADVRFSAVLSGGPVLQYRVQLPPDLKVESVAVSDASVASPAATRLARWSQDESGLLSVFLSEPSGAAQRLDVEGWSPTPQRGQWTLPDVRLENHEVQRSQIELFRYADVAVRTREPLQPLPAAAHVAATPGAAAERGRPIGHAPAGAEPLAVQLAPNAPTVEATQVTSLKRQARKWLVDVDYLLEARGGAVDALVWDLPPQVSGPFEATPAAAVQVLEVPGDARRQLVVTPDGAVEGKAHFRLSASVEALPGERLTAPGIAPSGPAVRQFVALPTEVEQRRVAWETRGLVRAELPKEVAAEIGPAATVSSWEVYRVVGPTFRATMRPAEQPSEQPKVLFQDVHLRFSAADAAACHGLAIFDLDPAGTATCIVELPPGFRLTQAFLAGRPAIAQAEGPGRWRIALSSDTFAQRIELLFEGLLTPGGARSIEMPLPKLTGAEVKQTALTLHVPGGLEAIGVRPGMPASGSELARRRLVNVAEIVKESAAIGEGDDAAGWYRPWAEALAGSLRAARASGGDDATIVSTAAAIEGDQRQIAEGLGARNVLEAALSRADGPSSPARLWDEAIGAADSKRQTLRFVSGGAAEAVRLEFAAAGERQLQFSRGIAILLALGLLPLGLVLARLGHWRAPRLWPYGLGVLLGLAWWLWLWPSALGLFAAAASVVLAIGSGRKNVERESPAARNAAPAA
ncbi:MAG: hypothetical protein HYS13_01300 [Planctomycetia bacterium]|nr:hypothetical protein [Planctomycetia bacterium]